MSVPHEGPADLPAQTRFVRDVEAPDGPVEDETCDHCGAMALSWRKCKLICANCSQIMKSCADL